MNIKYKIGILGSEGAGKTCFLGGLAHLTAPTTANGAFGQLSGHDDETKKYIFSILESFNNGEWPRKTAAHHRLHFSVVFRATIFEFELWDFAGEDFRRALSLGDGEAFPELEDWLKSCDFVLLLLSPYDLGVNDATPEEHDADPPDIELMPQRKSDSIDRTQRLQAFIEAAFAFLKRKRASEKFREIFKPATEPLDRSPSMAIVLTKADFYDPRHLIRTPADAQQFVENALPKFFSNLQGQVGSLQVFPVSAVGSLENGKPPQDDLKPFGYERIFEWIDEQLRIRRIMHALGHPASVTAGILAIVAVAIGGALVLQGSSRMNTAESPSITFEDAVHHYQGVIWKRASLQSRAENLLEARLDRLESEIRASNPGNGRLIEIEGHLSKAESLGDLFQAERARDLRAASVGIRDRRAYEMVRDLYEGRERERAIASGEGYLRDFSSGEFRDEVRRIRRELLDEELMSARRMIREMPADNRGALRAKLEQIRLFLDAHGSSLSARERERIEVAVDAGTRLLAKREFEIQLREAGRSIKTRKLTAAFSRGEEKVAEFETEDAGHVALWKDRGRFQLPWNPGDAISIELQAHRRWVWGTPTVGIRSSSEPLSLSLLGGRQEMFTVPDGWAEDFDGPPYVTVYVVGFTQADWQALADYVSPGSLWQ